MSFKISNFFGFIAEVVKNTLEAFVKNNTIDIDTIIAKSAASKLGVQVPFHGNSPDASQRQCSSMESSSQSSLVQPGDSCSPHVDPSCSSPPSGIGLQDQGTKRNHVQQS